MVIQSTCGRSYLKFFGDQKYLIIRTSWVLSATGNNFLKKIISLHAENKK